MSVLEQETLTFQEIPQQALRRLLRTPVQSDALRGACGSDCGRGEGCSTRSEEEQQLVCGSD